MRELQNVCFQELLGRRDACRHVLHADGGQFLLNVLGNRAEAPMAHQQSKLRFAGAEPLGDVAGVRQVARRERDDQHDRGMEVVDGREYVGSHGAGAQAAGFPAGGVEPRREHLERRLVAFAVTGDSEQPNRRDGVFV